MASRAFIERLYIEYADMVRAKLRRLHVEPEDIDDLCQSVFEIASRKRKKIPGDLDDARGWLLDAARKLAANDRKLWRRKFEVRDARAIAAAIATPEDPEAFYCLQHVVRAALRALDPLAAALLVVHHVEGCSLSEIAKARGVSKSWTHLQIEDAEAQFIAAMRKQASARRTLQGAAAGS
jgi:RNA polymerase sigma factor (sigma-70 family)